MALSENARRVKKEMSLVVNLRRSLTAAGREWDDLLAAGEELAVAPEWAARIHAERYALQKDLAQAQLNNWVRIQRGHLKDAEWRLLRLRYVQGLSWSDIIARVGQSKTYLLRLHNRALEKMAITLREKKG